MNKAIKIFTLIFIIAGMAYLLTNKTSNTLSPQRNPPSQY